MEITEINKEPLVLAKNWILNSGIQSDKGGFYAWYDMEKGKFSYIYSEITGYGITTLLFLHRLFKDDIFIKKAESAAEWIIEDSLHPSGGVRTRLYEDDKETDEIYSFSKENLFSFDIGMVLYGMVSLYGLTKKDRYLETSKKLADFLIDTMQNGDGSLSPIYDANAARVDSSYDKWSHQSGGFHAKTALGMVELFYITDNDKYSDSALRFCEYALSTQEDSGRFVTNRADNTTHIHPHCYSAEGLLYVGSSFKIEKFIDAAKRATEWAFEKVTDSGINDIYNPINDSFSNFQRSDILAQLLRLGTIFLLDKKIENLRSLLLSYQYHGKGPQNGGFLFSKQDKHINSWCSMFALQALAIHDNKKLISKNKKIELLI